MDTGTGERSSIEQSHELWQLFANLSQGAVGVRKLCNRVKQRSSNAALRSSKTKSSDRTAVSVPYDRIVAQA